MLLGISCFSPLTGIQSIVTNNGDIIFLAPGHAEFQSPDGDSVHCYLPNPDISVSLPIVLTCAVVLSATRALGVGLNLTLRVIEDLAPRRRWGVLDNRVK